MARGKKTTDFQKGKISKGNDAHFMRMFESLLYCERFINLTPSARILYVYMGLASSGKSEFKFPKSQYSRFMDKMTFERSKRLLIQNGFIEEIHSNATTPNVYRLSGLWKNDGKTILEEPRFYLKDGNKMREVE